MVEKPVILRDGLIEIGVASDRCIIRLCKGKVVRGDIAVEGHLWRGARKFWNDLGYPTNIKRDSLSKRKAHLKHLIHAMLVKK